MTGARGSAPPKALDAAVDAADRSLRELSLAIHGLAEVSREERRSSRLCADRLRAAGFETTFGTGDVETAFVAERRGRPGGRTIGLVAEYDALPEVGHGCGHNLIATAAVGAGIALAQTYEGAHTIQVLGTPAEEIGFGKQAMLDAGMLDGLDAALMIHPEEETYVLAGSNAARVLDLTFHGAEAHAGAEPWSGRSALDAVIALFNSVAALRQFTLDGERMHGIIREGGSAWNTVPERASARIGARAASRERVEELRLRLVKIAEAAALATGTTVEIEPYATYDDVRFCPPLAEAAHRALAALGVPCGPPKRMQASNDLGNLSRHLPVMQVLVRAWPQHVPFHTAELAEAASTELAHEAALTGAKVLARVAWELLTNDEVLAAARAQRGERIDG